MIATLPPPPGHPEPHTMRWTELELAAIRAYGAECARAEREAAAGICEQYVKHSLEEERPIAYVYGARECAVAIRARKDTK